MMYCHFWTNEETNQKRPIHSVCLDNIMNGESNEWTHTAYSFIILQLVTLPCSIFSVLSPLHLHVPLARAAAGFWRWPGREDLASQPASQEADFCFFQHFGCCLHCIRGCSPQDIPKCHAWAALGTAFETHPGDVPNLPLDWPTCLSAWPLLQASSGNFTMESCPWAQRRSGGV